MKKLIYLVGLLAMSCGHESFPVAMDGEETLVRFRVTGDFDRASFTRGDLIADGNSMTDLWVFDYVDGECVQSLHLAPEDEGWGQPSLTMKHGEHNVCFVAARGDEPVINEDEQVIEWTVPRDAFWGEANVSVSQSVPTTEVVLNRVATKLRLVATDIVPATAETVTATPAKWYYGLNYYTGEPAKEKEKGRSVTIPPSYAGTTGQLVVSFFGLSGLSEWNTDITLESKDADGNTIGSARIAAAPFKANRVTEYSGRLFTKDGSMDVSLMDEWMSAHTGTW